MTLSKNEQIALFIVVFLVIAVAGTILFLMPEYEKIEENKKKLEARKAEFVKQENELGLDKFQKLEQDIIMAFEDGKGASAAFYENEMTTYEADKLVQEILHGAGLSTDNLIVNPLTTHNLLLNIFREFDITYPIKDMAIISSAGNIVLPETSETQAASTQSAANGESAAQNPVGAAQDAAALENAAAALTDAVAGLVGASSPEDAELAAMMAFMMFAPRSQAVEYFEQHITDPAKAAHVVTAMREFLSNESETVAMQSVRFEIPMTKAEAETLSMYVYNLEDASYIVSMSTKELEQGTTTNEEGEEVPIVMNSDQRVYTIDLMFFIVQPMDEPNFDYEKKFKWDNKLDD